MIELWKKHPLFGRYEISTSGRIRTWEMGKKHANEKPPLLMAVSQNRDGYLYVSLWDGDRYRSRSVHRLVLETFYRPRHYGEEARHMDGDKNNNCLTNLAWGTHRDNEFDKLRNGTFGKKLKVRQVKEIKGLLGKWKRSEIAESFGVSVSMIDDIKSGKKWGAVSP